MFPTQCNWLSWYLSEQREELRVWFSVLCLGFGSQSVPTPSAELLHFWCVVSSLSKEASWCRRDDVCLAFIFFVSRVHICSSRMYSVHLTLWGVWWHYSLRLEYEGSCTETHITGGIICACLEVQSECKMLHFRIESNLSSLFLTETTKQTLEKNQAADFQIDQIQTVLD